MAVVSRQNPLNHLWIAKESMEASFFSLERLKIKSNKIEWLHFCRLYFESDSGEKHQSGIQRMRYFQWKNQV